MKKIISFVLVIVLVSCVCNTKAHANTGLNIDARSAVLIEPSTSKVLFEQNADERLAPASVTKVTHT